MALTLQTSPLEGGRETVKIHCVLHKMVVPSECVFTQYTVYSDYAYLCCSVVLTHRMRTQ